MAVSMKDILSLPVDERLEIVASNMASLPEDSPALALSEDRRRLLDNRLDDLSTYDEVSSSWEDIRARVFSQE